MINIFSIILSFMAGLGPTTPSLITPNLLENKGGNDESTLETNREDEEPGLDFARPSVFDVANINDDEDTTITTGETETVIEADTEDVTEKTCPEGKFLNPKTNRCKNLQDISETSTGKTITTYDPETGEGTTVKICNEGYYLNAETNRCNKAKDENSTSSVIKTCPEGKVLNPETNRCKKAKENDGEDYKLDVPELGAETNNKFAAISSIVIVVSIGLGFIAFQFRHEIVKLLRRLKSRLKG